MYNVAEYLPEFLASITTLEDRSQCDLELIFVDDGCDGRLQRRIIETWLEIPAATTVRARYARTTAVPGSARNAGLGLARGEWISFPDPDDVFNPAVPVSSWRLVRSRSEESAGAAMLACRPVRFRRRPRPVRATPHLSTSSTLDGGAARRSGRRTRSSSRLLHTITSFYRAVADPCPRNAFRRGSPTCVRGRGVQRGTTCHALPVRPSPFLGRAHYYYRKRARPDLVDRRCLARPVHGHRSFPNTATWQSLERSGDPVPRWIQHTVFYDLQWLFREPTCGGRLAASTLTACSRSSRLHDVLDRDRATTWMSAALLEFHAVDIPVRIRLSSWWL